MDYDRPMPPAPPSGGFPGDEHVGEPPSEARATPSVGPSRSDRSIWVAPIVGALVGAGIYRFIGADDAPTIGVVEAAESVAAR